MERAQITPAVLAWARERNNVSVEALARSLQKPAEAVRGWERGVEKPTLRQAEAVAAKLRVPLGYLYLEAPPKLTAPLPDLRTVGSQPLDDISADLRDVVNDAKRKQEWFREYRLRQGARPLPFVGKFSARSRPSAIAADLRSRLGIHTAEGYRRPSRPADYRKDLTSRAEDAGISVLRSAIVLNNTHRRLDVEEFRGFAIVDRYAPLVFVNGADGLRAQIFTLIHELAHVWAGVEGISVETLPPRAESSRSIERLCNAVAAEVLAPQDEFLERWDRAVPPAPQVEALSSHFVLSRQAVAIRARSLGLVSEEELALLSRGGEAPRPVRSPSAGGNFYESLRYKSGSRLLEGVLTEAMDGKMSFLEAGRLLNVRPKLIRAAAEALYS